LILSVDSVFGGVGLDSYSVEWSDSPVFTGTHAKPASGTSITLNTASDGIVSGTIYYIRVQTINVNGQRSPFCQRANVSPYLCPDLLVLLNGNIITGNLVSITPL